jgi:hypothetical protein
VTCLLKVTDLSRDSKMGWGYEMKCAARVDDLVSSFEGSSEDDGVSSFEGSSEDDGVSSFEGSGKDNGLSSSSSLKNDGESIFISEGDGHGLK